MDGRPYKQTGRSVSAPFLFLLVVFRWRLFVLLQLPPQLSSIGKFGTVLGSQRLWVIALCTALSEHRRRAGCSTRKWICHNTSHVLRLSSVKRQMTFVMLGELFDRAQHITAADLPDQAAFLDHRQPPTPATQKTLGYFDDIRLR